MRAPATVDVKAILTAVYRPPAGQLDQLASRVQSRIALIETLGECLRLVVEAPASALTATFAPTEAPVPTGEKDRAP